MLSILAILRPQYSVKPCWFQVRGRAPSICDNNDGVAAGYSARQSVNDPIDQVWVDTFHKIVDAPWEEDSECDWRKCAIHLY